MRLLVSLEPPAGAAAATEAVEPQQMIDDLLRAAPQARAVLDRYGLRGCGGPYGPHESLAFFARAHDVRLEQLLGELRQACAAPASIVEPAPDEQLADAIYRPFFRGAIAVALTLGAAWGAALLVRIARSGSFFAVGLHEVNAHGHAQIFGWVGLFVMGFAYQALPRFKHTSLAYPRWAYASFWLMLGGLVVRSSLEPGVSAWPWLGVPALAGSAAEVLAIAIFVAVITITLSRSGKPVAAYDYYVFAALAWFFIQAVYETVYFAATLRAADWQQLLGLVATWQAPLRETQIHGFAMLMILGMSQRIFPYFYGLPRTEPGRSLACLAAINMGLGAVIAGLVLMRAIGHQWAGLWYVGVLMMAGATAGLVWGWRIFARAEDSDRSLKFLRAAYVWLFIGLAMLVLLPIYQGVILPRLAPESLAAQIGFSHAYYGAVRHAVTVGFVSLMIVGVAAKAVPTLAGVDVHALGALWTPFVLINLGCATRVVCQVLTDVAQPAFPAAGVSGLLELAGLAVWGAHLWPMLGRLVEDRSSGGQTPAAVGPAGPEDFVADVIERNPQALDVFLSFGFQPLRNAALRRTVARRVTIRRACALMNVELEPLLAALNQTSPRSS